MSNNSFQLKGPGWYVTDYKDKKTGHKDREPTDHKSVANKGDIP